MSLRRLLLFLHLAGGLLAALFLIALGGSGALLVFEGEIDHALNPKLSRVEPHGQPLALDDLAARLEARHPHTRLSSVSFPSDPAIAYTLFLRSPTPGEKGASLAVDPYTGTELGDTTTKNNFTRQLHQFHTNLLLGPPGKTITVWAGIFLFGLAISGLILWWPRRLTWFSGAPGRRNFDLHNVLGFYSALFMLVFALTGIVIHFDDEAQKLLRGWTSEQTTPPPTRLPGPPKPGRPLSAGKILALAQEKLPGAQPATIQNLGNPGAAVRVTLKYPEDRTPAGRSILLFHPVTGELLWQQSSRTAPLSLRLVKLWNRELHTGDLAGWPTRLLASLASLCLPILALTGPLIWLQKLRRQRARPPT